jgi:hypothetical protein
VSIGVDSRPHLNVYKMWLKPREAGRGTIKTHFRNIFKLVFFHKLELSKINKMKHISVLEVVYYTPMTQSNINFCVYRIPI